MLFVNARYLMKCKGSRIFNIYIFIVSKFMSFSNILLHILVFQLILIQQSNLTDLASPSILPLADLDPDYNLLDLVLRHIHFPAIMKSNYLK